MKHIERLDGRNQLRQGEVNDHASHFRGKLDRVHMRSDLYQEPLDILEDKGADHLLALWILSIFEARASDQLGELLHVCFERTLHRWSLLKRLLLMVVILGDELLD